MIKLKPLHLLGSLVLCLSVFTALGQADTSHAKTKEKISFRDPEDNAFDMSSFLLEHRGLLLVPTVITEPAIGYGGGGGLVYFHNRKKQYASYVPPDISGVIGMYTENGTWGVGGFHMHTFGESRVRTLTAVMKPDVHYNYYGNNKPILEQYPLSVNLDAWLIFQKAQLRIADSRFFVGLSYTYFHSDIGLDTVPGLTVVNAVVEKLNVTSNTSTIKPMLVYDSRDNVFTATKGVEAELSLNYNAKWLGSGSDNVEIHTDFFAYVPLTDKLFSAYRFQGAYMLGNAPFYSYPFVHLRGVPAMRYQSDNTLVTETEWRYNFYKRYSVVAFTGVGKAFPTTSEFSEMDWSYNVGTGFRYEVARLLGIHMGADFAWGNAQDFAFYMVFGTAW